MRGGTNVIQLRPRATLSREETLADLGTIFLAYGMTIEAMRSRGPLFAEMAAAVVDTFPCCAPVQRTRHLRAIGGA